MLFTSLDCSATQGNLSKDNTDSFVGLTYQWNIKKISTNLPTGNLMKAFSQSVLLFIDN